MVKYKYIIRAIEERTKCQTTGTNIKKGVRESMERFHQKYGNLDHEESEIYDKYGNVISHDVGEPHFVRLGWDKIIGKNYDNLHIIHNHPNSLNDVPCCLSLPDMTSLLSREYNGMITEDSISGGLFGEPSDYLVRSITACGPNGSSMTLIRANDFPRNYFSHEDVVTVLRGFEKASVNYKEMYKDRYKWNMRNAVKGLSTEEKREMLLDSDFRKNVSRQTIKEIGDLNSFFEKEGIISDLDKIGCKLEIKESSMFDESWNDVNKWEIERFANR